MYSYEIVFQHPKTGKLTKKQKLEMMQTIECIVADNGLQALKHAEDQLKLFKDYELVYVVRRHPIIRIIKEKKDK